MRVPRWRSTPGSGGSRTASVAKPAPSSAREYDSSGNRRLTKRKDPVPVADELVVRLREVRARDDERCVVRTVLELSCVREGVRDADAEPTSRPQDATCLRDRARHVLDVDRDVVRDDQIEDAVREGQRRGIPDDVGSDRARGGSSLKNASR